MMRKKRNIRIWVIAKSVHPKQRIFGLLISECNSGIQDIPGQCWNFECSHLLNQMNNTNQSDQKQFRPIFSQIVFLLCLYFSLVLHHYNRLKLRSTMKKEQDNSLQDQYKDLLSNYRKMTWISVGSLLALTTTYVYSKYQIYRKKKIIDQKDNEISNQKEELFHIRAHAKQVNKELADQYSIILKNLKKTIVNDPNVQSLKNQINKPLEEINQALSLRIQQIKNYNYKQQMEKWYMSHLMGTALQFQRIRRIQIVQAHWHHIDTQNSNEHGYFWERDSSSSKFQGQYQEQYQKMKQYFERKNSYGAKGVQINANTNNLGDTFYRNNRLKLKYRCFGFDVNNGQLTIPLLSKIKQNVVNEKECIINEGEQRYMECNEQWVKKQ